MLTEQGEAMTTLDYAPALALAAGMELPPGRQVARNPSTASENKIHDDAIAKQYGFSGGLVPGATSYAYLAGWLTRTLGPVWAAHGSSSISLVRPVYEGEAVSLGGRVVSVEGDTARGRVEIDCWVDGPDGVRRAQGGAGLSWGEPPVDEPRPHYSVNSERPRRPEERGTITATTAPVGMPLPPVEIDTSPGGVAQYLSDIDNDDPLFGYSSSNPKPLVHPGWYPNMANRVLSANFVLNAWIHTRSEIRHLAPAVVGGTYRGYGQIVEAFEKRGHEYVTVDVLIADGADTPIARLLHTAIVVVARRG
jgi:acyl dehydratase